MDAPHELFRCHGLIWEFDPPLGDGAGFGGRTVRVWMNGGSPEMPLITFVPDTDLDMVFIVMDLLEQLEPMRYEEVVPDVGEAAAG